MGLVEQAQQAGRRDRASIHGEGRVGLAGALVGAPQEVQAARRTVVLIVPGAILPDRVLDATLRQRNRGRRAVTERHASPERFGYRRLVLGEQLLGAVRPSRLRVEPRQDQIRPVAGRDRKSTRLNSSHGYISYAVFCLKKKKKS